MLQERMLQERMLRECMLRECMLQECMLRECMLRECMLRAQHRSVKSCRPEKMDCLRGPGSSPEFQHPQSMDPGASQG